MIPDRELLRKYAENGSQSAFTDLVERHTDFVYSVALRRLGGDSHLAEDVTQTVFTALATQASRLLRHPTLAGWLHTTAHYASTNAIRKEQRRRAREQEVFAMSQNPTTPEISWEQLRPVLDDAINRLNQNDRVVLLLRFFQNKSHREVGEILGLSEASARRRGDRALEKLRAHFSRRHATVSAVVLAEAIAANSLQAAPIGLAPRVAAAAITGAVEVGASIGVSVWAGRIIFMTTKKKILIAIALIIIVGLFTMSWPKWAGLFSQNDDGKSAAGSKNDKIVVQAPRAAPVPASASTTQSTLTGPNQLLPGVYPKYVGGILSQSGYVYDRNVFGNMFLKLKFTQDQEDAFLKILKDKADQSFELSITADKSELIKMMNSGKSVTITSDKMDEMLHITPQIKAIADAADAQLRQLLGSDVNYNYYQDYVNENSVRLGVVEFYESALQTAGVPGLSVDQQETLVSFVQQSIQPGDASLADYTRHLPQILDQASTILTSEQIDILKKNPQTFLLNFTETPGGPPSPRRGGSSGT